MIISVRLAEIVLLDDDERSFFLLKGCFRDFSGHTLRWFSTYASFVEDGRTYNLLLLDYALEREMICTDQVFADLRPRAKIIIAFSSSKAANQRLIACGADFAVTKGTPATEAELFDLFLELL